MLYPGHCTPGQIDHSIQGGPQSQPTCNGEEKISTPTRNELQMSGHPAHMLSHLTSFVWVSAQRLTLATYIKQTISVIKQKNMFPQMQNNALSTIYMQIQVFLDVTPCSS